MQLYNMNIHQVMIFRLYTTYNKQKMIKIDNQKREKSQVTTNAQIILLRTEHRNASLSQ